MLDVLLSVVLPIFLVAGSSALLQRLRPGALGLIGPAAIYLLAPALVLDGLLRSELSAAVSLRVVVAAGATLLTMMAVSWAVSRALRHDRPTESGFLLAGTFGNAGNMGIPLSFLAFGDEGLSIAIMVFVAQASLSWPVGIYLAARGSARGWRPLAHAAKVPTLYVVPIALLLRALDRSLPAALDVPIGLLADAAVPGMLLVLGYQLAGGIALGRRTDLIAALVTRLLIGAAVAVGIAALLGLEGTARNTVILIAAMPTAVFTTILATEFGAAPRFVTGTVVVGTLASLPTLTVLIALLQRWS